MQFVLFLLCSELVPSLWLSYITFLSVRHSAFLFLLFVDLSGIHYNRFFRKRFPAYFRARSMQEIEAFGDQIKSEFFVYVVCVSIVGPYIAIVQKETTLIFPLIILTAIYSYVVWKLPHIEAFEIKR